MLGTTTAPATPASPAGSCGAMWRLEASYRTMPDQKAALQALHDAADACIHDGGGGGTAYSIRGQTEYRQGDMTAAEADFRQALTVSPDDGPAHYNLGLIALRANRDDEAIAQFSAVLAGKGDSALAYINRGRAYFDKKDFAKALDDAASGIAAKPELPEGYVFRALVRARTSDFDGCIADLTSALSLDETRGGGLYAVRADCYRKKKDMAAARKDIETAIGVDPNDAYALSVRGYIESASQQYDAAIADFNQSLAREPSDSWVIGGRAIAYAHNKQFDLAIADYDKAIALSPDSSSLYFDRGMAKADKQDYAGAIADYTAALSRTPDDPGTLVRRAVAYRHAGKTDEAEADLSRAIAIDPRHADAYIERGVIRREKNDIHGAEADYDAAIAADPNYGLAYADRGILWAKLARYDLAQADADKAAALDPSSALALYLQCWTRAVTNRDLNTALTACDRSLKIRPDLFEALDSRGFVHFRQGNFTAALADYEAALVLKPQNPTSLYMRGIVKLRLGRTAEGQADIDAAKALSPNPAAEYATYGVTP